MADDPNVNIEGNEGNADPDYKTLYEEQKAEARKWESRAKSNKEKAAKLDAMLSGSDSIEDRIAALEATNKELEAAKARQDTVAKVSAATGVSAEIVASLNGSDEDSLTKQAQAIADLMPKGAPNAPEAGKFPRGEAAETDAEEREFIRKVFGKDN